MRFIFNEIATVFVVVLLLFLVLATKANSEEIRATCWTDKGGNNIPCKLRTLDDDIWLLNRSKWVSDYVISDTTEIDGVLYILLLEKGQ